MQFCKKQKLNFCKIIILAAGVFLETRIFTVITNLHKNIENTFYVFAKEEEQLD